MQIDSPKELNVYKKAHGLAMDVFQLSKSFPIEERFALTSQIRRSSRSICLNLREAWAKRRYEAHFVSKLTDCDGENGETESSLDLAKDCGYISADKHSKLTSVSAEIGKMLHSMCRTEPLHRLTCDLRPLTSAARRATAATSPCSEK